jgi:hypothetical protein
MIQHGFFSIQELVCFASFQLSDIVSTCFLFLLLGILTSNARLDYEESSIYFLSVVLEPGQLNCSLVIILRLLNLPDNPITFDPRSLTHTVERKLPIPCYLGRIHLFDVDQLLSPNYRFYLSNQSAMISIDPTTGSIVLKQRIHKKLFGSNLNYEVIATNTKQQHNLTGLLVIGIRQSSAGVLSFGNDHYRINVSRSLRLGSLVFRAIARTDDSITHTNITYSLIDGADEFSLEKSTGSIRLNGYLPLSTTKYALTVEAKEEETELTAKTMVVVTLLDDQDSCFNVINIRQCSIASIAIIGTSVCTLGNNAQDCLYQLIDPMTYFTLAGKNGMIINRNVFQDEIAEQEYNVTMLAWSRRNRVSSSRLSSMPNTVVMNDIPLCSRPSSYRH